MVTGRRSSYTGSAAAGALVAAALVLGGCTALTRDVLVKESGQPAQAVASHCSGSEWMDNSMIAVVPIPIVAFAMPTQELNEIKTDDVLRRCGPPERLANRRSRPRRLRRRLSLRRRSSLRTAASRAPADRLLTSAAKGRSLRPFATGAARG